MIFSFFPTLVTLFMGLIIGFLAQRSRMCFIAGFRDFFLIRDTELLKGILTFFTTIWMLTSIFSFVGYNYNEPLEYGISSNEGDLIQIDNQLSDYRNSNDSENNYIKKIKILEIADISISILFISFIGGIVMGVLTTLSGGCVLRQHVLLSQGNGDSFYFLIGFISAVPIYYKFLARYIVKLY